MGSEDVGAVRDWEWLVKPAEGEAGRATGKPEVELQVRVAQTRADADTVRALIGDDWPVSQAQDLFDRVIAPSRVTRDLRKLDALCLLVDATDATDAPKMSDATEGSGRRTIGTFSVVLDHRARTVEVGRGAIAPGWRRHDLAMRALAPLRRVFALLPTYCVMGEVTTLSRGAARAALGLEMRIVALHPSNASVAAKDVPDWHARLADRRGPELAELLVRRSRNTGLGRFMTCHHVRRPTSFAPFSPALTPAQQPFFAHTCRALELDAATEHGTGQRARLRSMDVRDRSHTATRTLLNPPRALDVNACVAAALSDGFETLVVQVPCDPQHLGISERLEQAGALLGGLIVDPRGYWRASYTLATSPQQATRMHDDLAQLAESHAFEGATRSLLRLVSSGAAARLERAC